MNSPVDKASEFLINHIDKYDITYWQNHLEKSYEQYYLLQDKKWVSDSLEMNKDFLLIENIEVLKHFIKTSQKLIKDNPYFLEIFEIVKHEASLKKLEEIHLSQLICFAYSLDRINVLMRQNLDFSEFLIFHFYRQRKKRNFYRFGNVLRIIKFHSIQLPLIRFLKCYRKGFIGSSFGKIILVVNIFEAFLVDLFRGFVKNALSCVPLMIFSPNFKAFFILGKFFKKGEKSRFSKDGKGVEMFSPSQKKWSDLYQSWNYTFVSQFPQAPYLLVKLLIPSVSEYKNKPGSYMHTRITALFLCLNFVDFATNDCVLEAKINDITEFSHENIVKQGEANHRCSIDYRKSVQK